MNELGAIILLLSGGTVLFSILTAALGLSLRLQRELARSVLLEALDRGGGGAPTRTSLAGRFARLLIKPFRATQLFLLEHTGLQTQALSLELSRRAIYANLILSSLAVLLLMSMMLAGDLSNRYVVFNSASDLPFFFRVTGTWAGSSGSLLFWYFLLTLFSAIVVYQTRERLYNRLPVLFLILGFLQLLFVLLTLFFKDAQPFLVFPQPMQAGRGINPLLLHWAMIIHPPILYVGYVSFAIPFAIAMSALVSGNLRNDWLPLMRRWSIFAWFFLGTGILLGSKWAYEELGWGGYWAWDPVENASLMPFLLGTAFLHSLIVQERRGLLRFWNAILITAAYHMCLVGTWITRSGVLEGPHSFAESSIGKPMIAYVALSFVFSMRYVYFRRRRLKPEQRMEVLTSKEGSMLLNNFLMTLGMFIVLAGVFSPLLPIDCVGDSNASMGFSCHAVEWKQSAYNKVMVPLGLFTLFLMGASPLLAWRKSAFAVWKKTLRIPLALGLLGGIVFGLVYRQLFTETGYGGEDSAWGPGIVAEILAVLTVGIAIFTIAGITQEYIQGVRSRMKRFGENIVMAWMRLVLRNKRRYAGYLVHLAIVFLFVGYAGSAFKQTEKFEFHYVRMPYASAAGDPVVYYYSGDKAYLENYEIQARELFLRPEFKANADVRNPVDFTIAQEAHYHVMSGSGAHYAPTFGNNGSPHALANVPPPRSERLLKLFTGYVRDGRMRTERHFHPMIDPVTGRVQRSADGRAGRTPTSKPDIRSTWYEDIYIQLGAIRDPAQSVNPDLNNRYEFYYFGTEIDRESYETLFPESLVATLEVWINPMVKFIWLGSLMFFFSGLILVIPYGEKPARGDDL